MEGSRARARARARVSSRALLLNLVVSMYIAWPAKSGTTPTTGFGATVDGETAAGAVFGHCGVSSWLIGSL